MTWQPATTPPPEPGVYEIRGTGCAGNKYSKWTGEQWNACAETVEEADSAPWKSDAMYEAGVEWTY